MSIRHLLPAMALTVALLACATAAKAQYEQRDCYMFGFAASFSDSTVYITDIQHVDSAYFGHHNGFLYGRDQYSNQLRDYLAAKGFPNPTCITAFSRKKKDIEKEFLKIKRRYTKDGGFTFKQIAPTEFSFVARKPDPSVLVVNGGGQGKGKE